MHDNFYYNLKVYYEDTDCGGVVYYANYLKFLERARTEALVSLGFSNNKIKKDFGALIIVKSCNINYKKPAYLEDELKIRSFVKSVTKTSFFMSQFISRDDELIVEAKVHLVFVDKNGKTPDDWIEDLEEGTLHHWFRGSRSKGGKPGWVQADGSPCANEPGETKTPKCFSSGRLKSLKRKGKKGLALIKSATDFRELETNLDT